MLQKHHRNDLSTKDALRIKENGTCEWQDRKIEYWPVQDHSRNSVWYKLIKPTEVIIIWYTHNIKPFKLYTVSLPKLFLLQGSSPPTDALCWRRNFDAFYCLFTALCALMFNVLWKQQAVNTVLFYISILMLSISKEQESENVQEWCFNRFVFIYVLICTFLCCLQKGCLMQHEK